MTLQQMITYVQTALDDIIGVGYPVNEVINALDVELQMFLDEAFHRRDERALYPYMAVVNIPNNAVVPGVVYPVALHVVVDPNNPATWIAAHYVPWDTYSNYMPTTMGAAGLPFPRTCRWTVTTLGPLTFVPPFPAISRGLGMNVTVMWDPVFPTATTANFYFIGPQPSLAAQGPGYIPPLPIEYHLTVVWRAIKRLIKEYQRTEAERYQLPEWIDPRREASS